MDDATKRQRITGREERKDRLSDLPDCILLHIMKFMDTRDAILVGVLSKRWKNLWKSLTNLSFSRKDFKSIKHYNKSVSQVLSRRDGCISLFHLKLDAFGVTASKFLNMALTFLKVSVSCADPALKLPKSLSLPKLKSLHLESVSFTASDDNDYAEPFSTCNLLSTLVLTNYSLHDGPKVLCISNANLSTLKLEDRARDITHRYTYQPKIVLSTPNLISITFIDSLIYTYHQLSSTCDLSFLEEVNIETSSSRIDYSVVLSWLQVLSNVKILTVSSFILKIILKDLSNLAVMETQPPRFVRLESLKMKMFSHSMISDKEVIRAVQYLFQNSSLTRVAVINC